MEQGSYSDWKCYRCNPRQLLATPEERNETAIRAALMLGAEFEHFGAFKGTWRIKGLDHLSYSKGDLAFMFILTYGYGVDEFGRLIQIKDTSQSNG
jgi:hypothetical protein